MRTIAIAAGGNSSEFDISIKSAKAVEKILSLRYVVYIIMISDINWYWEDAKGRYFTIDKNDFSLKLDYKRVKFDAVFIAIHGSPGENGLLQGYFDMLEIPYTSCSAFVSALTFNKHATKLYLKEYDIRIAEALLIRKGDNVDGQLVENKIGLPCFVKPNDSGSSFGVTMVKNKMDLSAAIEKAFGESDQVMIEAFMNGREVACGVLKSGSKVTIMPVTEIISKNEFFDYEAKYTVGRSEEITPADLPEEVTGEIKRLSSLIYDLLGCSGIVRVDFIVINNQPWFLEINTVPGMTEESLIPKQAEAAGLSLEELYSTVIEELFD
jgi:D-alanine-D-alanine ligase